MSKKSRNWTRQQRKRIRRRTQAGAWINWIVRRDLELRFAALDVPIYPELQAEIRADLAAAFQIPATRLFDAGHDDSSAAAIRAVVDIALSRLR